MKSEATLHPFDQLLEIDTRSRERIQSISLDSEQLPGLEGKLALRLGGWYLMLSLNDIAELVSVPRITRVPGVKPWLLGIANLRGTIITVIDLREFLDGKSSASTSNSRTVVFRLGGWHYGLLVDEIIGMRHFGPENKVSASDAINPNIRPYLTEVFHSEEKEWWAFSIDRLRSSPEFLGAAS